MSEICVSCRKPKAPYQCGICQGQVCKSCAQFQDEDINFMPKIPAALSHPVTCSGCFADQVEAPLAQFRETMEKAKEVVIFTKEQSKQTRYVKRKHAPYVITDCEDEAEAIMRMSYLAASEGMNCLVDIEVSTRKIVVGSHKKTVFTATAIPVDVDPSTIRESWGKA